MAFLNDTSERTSPNEEADDRSRAHSAPTSGAFSNRVTALILTLIAMTTALFLSPILKTPFLGDDAFNSYFIGKMGYDHLSVTDWFFRYNQYVISRGRFFPGMTVIQISKFMLTQSPVTMKALNIAAIALTS